MTRPNCFGTMHDGDGPTYACMTCPTKTFKACEPIGEGVPHSPQFAAMMAPDYAWWHGFYELKKRFMEIEEQAEQLLKSAEPAKVFEVKGAGGDTTKPDFDK